MKTNEQKIYYTLRIASAMCFIGHGSFGIITKAVWCNYFAVFGIGHNTAYTLMPYLGTIDILMGLSLLFYPTKTILGWLVVWGFITACLRPLSGEPFAELIERGGNYGAPLALLILAGSSAKGFFSKVNPVSNVSASTLSKVSMCLRIVVFLLFVGHGWLNLIDKKGLLDEYASLGFTNPSNVAQVIGIFEIAAACFVLIKPVREVILFLFIWKVASEFFYPKWEILEWIERGGSYGSVLALWFILPETANVRKLKFAVQN